MLRKYVKSTGGHCGGLSSALVKTSKVKLPGVHFCGFKEELPECELTDSITSPPSGGTRSGFSNERPRIMTARQFWPRRPLRGPTSLSVVTHSERWPFTLADAAGGSAFNILPQRRAASRRPLRIVLHLCSDYWLGVGSGSCRPGGTAIRVASPWGDHAIAPRRSGEEFLMFCSASKREVHEKEEIKA